jgi:hypothetical protein
MFSGRGVLIAVTVVGTFTAFQLGGSLTAFGRWYWKQWRLRRSRSLGLKDLIREAGPLPLPAFGNSLYLTRFGFFQALYQSCLARPVTLFWLTSSPLLVVSSADLVQQVLTSRDYEKPRYFGYRSRTVKAALELHQTAQALREKIEVKDDVEPHIHVEDPSRAALLNLIDDSIGIIAKDTKKFFLNLLAEGYSESFTNRKIQQFYVKLNCKVLFGLDLTDKEAARVALAIERAGDEFSKRMVFPHRGLMAWSGNIRYIWYISVLLLFGRRILQHLHTSSHPWIHGWLGKVGRLRKLAKVLGLLMAATQTVPIAASWALMLIGSHENVRKRLTTEAHHLLVDCAREKDSSRKYDPGADLSLDTLILNENFSARGEETTTSTLLNILRKESYIDAIVRETLRLYPPFPIIQRQAQCDNFLGEIHVPAGTIVAAVPWLMHHHPGYWDKAELFNPDRWISGGVDSARHGDAPSDYCYIPFGRGRRMCAGNPLAIIELKCLVLCAALCERDWFVDSEIFQGATIGHIDPIFPPLTMRPPQFRLGTKAQNLKDVGH